MLYFRDDDILVNSSYYADPIDRFKKVHRWIAIDASLMHVPTIVSCWKHGSFKLSQQIDGH